MIFKDLIDDKDTQTGLDVLREYCLNNCYTISVAESATAGMMQLMLSSCKNAGMFFSGGITAYCCLQKLKQLSVNYEDCIDQNGVTKKIAETMALHICRKFNSDLGLSLTGFAAPVPEKNIYELYAYGSFCLKGKIVFTEKFVSDKSDPVAVQHEYASSLLKMCSNYVSSLYLDIPK